MKKRLISMAMALLFIASLPISAFAEEYDLAKGSITVEATASTGGEGEAATTTQTVTYYETEGGQQKTQNDPNPVITQSKSETATTPYTVTIKANGADANVTLKDVNISRDGTNEAAVSTNGEGNVTIELDGTNKVVSGNMNAGLEKNNNGSLTITDKSGTNGSLTATGGVNGGAGIGSAGNYGNKTEVSNIEITGGEVTANGGSGAAGIGGGLKGTGTDITISGGTVEATGGQSGAGIGGGFYGNGYNITISGGTVTAKGGKSGAGIGNGAFGDNISDGYGRGDTLAVSGDAEVKVQGGDANGTQNYGTGAAVGGGGGKSSGAPVNGGEAAPDVSKLTTNGKIEYYAPSVDMNDSEVKPTDTIIGKYVPSVAAKAVSKTDSQTVNSYSVVGKDGKSIGYKTEVKDGVLTITVDADYAVLTGAAANISALTAQGITTVVFVTSGATSTFDLADLSAKGSGTYKLTHDGATVTFTLGTTDISEILK